MRKLAPYVLGTVLGMTSPAFAGGVTQETAKPSKTITQDIKYEGKIEPFYVYNIRNSEEAPGRKHQVRTLVETEERVGGKEIGVKMEDFPSQVLPVDVIDAHKVWLGDKDGEPIANFDGKNGLKVYAFNDGTWFHDGVADSTEIAEELNGRGQIRYAVELHEDGNRIDSVQGTIHVNSVNGTPRNVHGLEAKISSAESATEPNSSETALTDTLIEYVVVPNHKESRSHIYVEAGTTLGDLHGNYFGAGIYPHKKLGLGVRAGNLDGSIDEVLVNDRVDFESGDYHVKKQEVNHNVESDFVGGVLTYRPTKNFGLQFMAGRVNGDDKQTETKFLANYNADGTLIADPNNPRVKSTDLGSFDTSANIYSAGVEFRFGGDSAGLALQGGLIYVDHKNENLDDNKLGYIGLKGEF